jgi:hypothetical protein
VELDPRISTGMLCFNGLRPNVESDSDPVKMASEGDTFQYEFQTNSAKRVRIVFQERYFSKEHKVT